MPWISCCTCCGITLLTRSLALILPGSHDGVCVCQKVLCPRNVALFLIAKDCTALQPLRLLVPREGSVPDHLHEFSATTWLKNVLCARPSARRTCHPDLLRD
jgi:hypothetical protein